MCRIHAECIDYSGVSWTRWLFQGTAAVPVSMRLPEAASMQSIQSAEDTSDAFSPTGIRDKADLLQDQVCLHFCL